MTVEQFTPDPQRLAAYARQHIGDGGEFMVSSLKPMFGGSSRLSFRFDYTCTRKGEPVEGSAILRCIPTDGGVSPGNASREYQVLSALHQAGYAVPEAMAYSADPADLGCEFLIMEEIKGCEATLEALLEEPFVSQRDSIGKDCWTLMGQLAAFDPVALGLIAADKAAAYAAGWEKLLAGQEKIFRATAVYVDPITEAVFGWLRNNPPPTPAKPAIVHGDFRSGNFLYSPQGRVTSVLDWELWYIGDPLFDLAYSLMTLWADEQGRAGRLLARDQAITLWEQASGIKVDHDALRWWEVFCCQRFLATNHSIYRRFLNGSGIDAQMPVLMLDWGAKVESQVLQLITGKAPEPLAAPGEVTVGLTAAGLQQMVARVLDGPVREQLTDDPWWSLQVHKLADISRYSTAAESMGLVHKMAELEAMQSVCA